MVGELPWWNRNTCVCSCRKVMKLAVVTVSLVHHTAACCWFSCISTFCLLLGSKWSPERLFLVIRRDCNLLYTFLIRFSVAIIVWPDFYYHYLFISLFMKYIKWRLVLKVLIVVRSPDLWVFFFFLLDSWAISTLSNMMLDVWSRFQNKHSTLDASAVTNDDHHSPYRVLCSSLIFLFLLMRPLKHLGQGKIKYHLSFGRW